MPFAIVLPITNERINGIHRPFESMEESSSESEDEERLLQIAPEVFTETPELRAKRVAALEEKKRQEEREWGVGGHQSRWATDGVKAFKLLSGRNILYRELPDQQFLLWDCAVILSRYLETGFKERLKGKKVIELGCGLGLPSMVAHLMGAAQVLLTERESAIQNLTAQLRTNKYPSSISAAALHWGAEEAARVRKVHGAFDIVLLSDCIYAGDSLNTRRLLETIKTVSHEGTVIVSCHEMRFQTSMDGSQTQLHLFRSGLYDLEWCSCTSVPIQTFVVSYASQDKLALHVYERRKSFET